MLLRSPIKCSICDSPDSLILDGKHVNPNDCTPENLHRVFPIFNSPQLLPALKVTVAATDIHGAITTAAIMSAYRKGKLVYFKKVGWKYLFSLRESLPTPYKSVIATFDTIKSEYDVTLVTVK